MHIDIDMLYKAKVIKNRQTLLIVYPVHHKKNKKNIFFRCNNSNENEEEVQKW